MDEVERVVLDLLDGVEGLVCFEHRNCINNNFIMGKLLFTEIVLVLFQNTNTIASLI
jgi:hypothetical protein